MKKLTHQLPVLKIASYGKIVEARNIFADFRAAKIDSNRHRCSAGILISVVVCIFVVTVLILKPDFYIQTLKWQDSLSENMSWAFGVFAFLFTLASMIGPGFIGSLPIFVYKEDNDSDVTTLLSRVEKITQINFPFEVAKYDLDYWGSKGEIKFQYYSDETKKVYFTLVLDSSGSVQVIRIEGEGSGYDEEVLLFNLKTIFDNEVKEITGYPFSYFKEEGGNEIVAYFEHNGEEELRNDTYLVKY